MPSKPITIVDEHNIVVGSMPMEEAWLKGITHRLVRILVVDTEGNVLLQLRSKSMKTAPGLWDNSAAGHVDADEPYEVAASRELAEETGLTEVSLELVKEYYSEQKEKNYHLKRFNRLYKVNVDKNVSITPQQEEVEELKWFDRASLKTLIENSSDKFTKGLVESLEFASFI